MNATSSYPVTHPRVVRRTAMLALTLWASAGFAAPSDSKILFAHDTPVPPSVQNFAWRVIETRCSYQSFEREQRSFWAFRTHASRIAERVIYSINIVSTLTWKKTEPPAIIEMTVVDDGGMQLTALHSSFIACTLPPG